jgi:hypothetical protein
MNIRKLETYPCGTKVSRTYRTIPFIGFAYHKQANRCPKHGRRCNQDFDGPTAEQVHNSRHGIPCKHGNDPLACRACGSEEGKP